QAMNIPVEVVHKVGEGRPDVADLIAQGKVGLVVNTPSAVRGDRRPPAATVPSGAEERGVALPLAGKRTVGYRIRTAALDYHVPYVTTLVALRATVAAVRALHAGRLPIRALGEIIEHGLEA
ncbi:MAG: hypothetical protein E3J64_08885, partial [Anaerolineales bacterium]